MVKGPGYTIDDLIYYTGLFAGLIGTFLTLNAVVPEWPHIAKLIIAGIVGIGLGWCCTTFFSRSSNDRFD
ncbi:hypothetical protein AB1L30_23050 [Bremerella sp. JC817]|uniref:hypothetical protein n=1 Tax=Bremerella sp. JC817 TaxID=3231756 RepID=UPI00345A906B